MSNFGENHHCMRIASTLRAYGYRTSKLKNEAHLLAEAQRVFDLPPGDPKATIDRIASLPKAERKRRALKGIFGKEIDDRGKVASDGADTKSGKADPKDLLHQVVMALISRGQADILNELPDVLAYYGAAIPTVAEVMDVWPEMIEGDVRHDDLVYSFRVARPVKAQESAPLDSLA